MHKLPFDSYEEQFLQLVQDHQVVILAAETGAGKSTKAPLALLKRFANGKMIGVTEPRRPAATNLAKWVAELHGSRFGEIVGYQIGQDSQVNRSTKLKYMTEGILLAEMQGDVLLSHYSVIVLDEVHERGVNQDLLMALVKAVLPHRHDLKVVVMSATIDTHKFSKYFGDAPVLEVPGRVFPVEVRYEKEAPHDYIKACVEKIVDILKGREDGDILVFLPDQESIMKVVDKLEGEFRSSQLKARVLPLFGSQAPEDQAKVFERNGMRRVIVATNIAETSLTIDGVRHIVDTGLIKAMCYVDASMSALQVTEHSRAGCDQRKGRAGRTQDGICHRLFTEYDFNDRPGFTEPEIKRMALDQVLLRLLCMGLRFEDVLKLDLLDKPSDDNWKDAENRLKTLGALSSDGSVNSDGRRMNKMQVEPMIGRMILEGEKHGCLDEVISVAAALSSTRPVFVRPKGVEKEADASHKMFYVEGSDPLTYASVWNKWVQNNRESWWARNNFVSSKALSQIDRMRQQLIRVMERDGVEITSSNDKDKLRKAVASGLIVNLAIKGGRFNYSWNGRATFVFPGSTIFSALPEMLVCTRVVQSSKAFMRGCHSIEKKWLIELLPEHMLEKKFSFTGNYDSIPNSLVRTLSWQGTIIGKEEVRTFGESDLVDVAQALIDDANNWIIKKHPSSTLNAVVIKEVNAEYAHDTAKLTVVALKILNKLFQMLAGIRTYEDLMKADLRLDLRDFLSDNRFAELQSGVEARLAEDQATAERRAVIDTQWKAREEEQRRMREERVASAREAVDAISAKAEKLGIANYSEVARYRVGAERSPEYDWMVDPYRDAVRRVEREVLPKIEATEKIYADVLTLMPACPLCGGDWSESFICNAKHDPNRLVAKDGSETSRFVKFGRFVSNRGDEVGVVSLWGSSIQLRFSANKGQAFSGRTFKSIEYEALSHVLPEELAESSDDIREWLKELRNAERMLKKELEEVEQIRQNMQNGDILRLTFKTGADGQAVAEHRGTTYVATYADLYPCSGETWYCKIGSKASVMSDQSVTAIRKAGEFSAVEDVDKLRKDIVDLFGEEVSELVH